MEIEKLYLHLEAIQDILFGLLKSAINWREVLMTNYFQLKKEVINLHDWLGKIAEEIRDKDAPRRHVIGAQILLSGLRRDERGGKEGICGGVGLNSRFLPS